MIRSFLSRAGVRDRISTRPGRVIATAAAVLTALATIVVGWNDGYPTSKVRLLSGTAWLPSSQVGQLTLLDGASTEVAAQVPVAPPGDQLDSVQAGTAAYAINHTSGSIRRIDGATLELTEPVTPIPHADEGLQAYANAEALYALDSHHGVLVQADPTTLTPRDGPTPLAAQLGVHTATLDGANRLWVLDVTTGDLSWITEGQRHTRRQVAQPGFGVLALAGGGPVLIDTQARTASILDPDSGDTTNTTQLGLHPNDTIQVGGSPHERRLYVVTSRGALTVCELTSTSCADEIPLADAGTELGPPIETAGRIFVPDYTSGRVWIVDLKEKSLVAHPSVLAPPVHFQLLTHDGVVFFNDPDSERAGVIRLDGSVVQVSKYLPQDPSKSLTAQPAHNAAPPSASKSRSSTTPTEPTTKNDPRLPIAATTSPTTPDPQPSSPAPKSPATTTTSPGKEAPSNPPPSNPPHSPDRTGLPPQPDPSSCTAGNEVKLGIPKKTSGTKIPFSVEVKCPPSAGRSYVLIIELDLEDAVYYYPKQGINSSVGTYRDSISLDNSQPNSTRKIFVISIDNNQLSELHSAGSDGELVTLPNSAELVSKKYTHVRTS